MPQGLHSEGPLLLRRTAIREQTDRTQPTLPPGPTYSRILFTYVPDISLFPYQQDAQALEQPANISILVPPFTDCTTLGMLVNLFLSFHVCNTGKMVVFIQLMKAHVMSIKYSYKNTKDKTTPGVS